VDLHEDVHGTTAIPKKVESAVVKAGGKGRMGTWAYSFGFANSAALAEFGKRIVEKKTKLGDFKTLMECFAKYTPGARWNGGYYTDLSAGTKRKNYVLIYHIRTPTSWAGATWT
jgi:hypothetical protein